MKTSQSQVIVERPTEDKLKQLGVRTWPIWTKETSRFDWHYDQTETCFFLEGEVTVETPQGPVNIGKGDLVTFAKDLGCTWIVRKAVRKHYRFA